MKRTGILGCVAAACSLAAASAVAADGYELHIIEYPGALSTNVIGINNRGVTAGNAEFSDMSLPFTYNVRKEEFTPVAPVTGYVETFLVGISDSGTVVGTVTTEDTGVIEGLIIDRRGNTTVFAHPEAVTNTQARDANRRGQVTGFRDSADDLFAPENGFIYDSKTGEFTDIVPSLFTIAQGINNRGEVVGSALYFGNEAPCPADPEATVRYGWLRSRDGAVTFFTVNGSNTSARGLSERGTVTGFVSTETGVKGFVTELDGTPCQDITIPEQELLAVPGFDLNFASAVNNRGQIAGGARGGAPEIGFVAKPIKKKSRKNKKPEK